MESFLTVLPVDALSRLPAPAASPRCLLLEAILRPEPSEIFAGGLPAPGEVSPLKGALLCVFILTGALPPVASIVDRWKPRSNFISTSQEVDRRLGIV